MKSLRVLAVFAAFIAPAFGAGQYVVRQDANLSGAGTKVSVHIPAGSPATIRGTVASVYCSVACEVTVERDGTAPTTTAVVPTKILGTSDTARSMGYTSSNVGSGTVIGGPHLVIAGTTLVLDMAQTGARAGGNITIVVSSITGRAVVNFQYLEQ